jgi:hypothetical protein
MTRSTVIANLITALKLINGTGGYYTDIDDRVYAWRLTALLDEELPAIVVRDVQDVIDPEEMKGSSEQWTHKLEIEIELILKSGALTLGQVRELIADSYKALGADRTLAGSCLAIYGTGDVIVTPDEQNKNLISGAKINTFALYQTNAFAN